MCPPPKITAYKLYLPLRKFNNGGDSPPLNLVSKCLTLPKIQQIPDLNADFFNIVAFFRGIVVNFSLTTSKTLVKLL